MVLSARGDRLIREYYSFKGKGFKVSEQPLPLYPTVKYLNWESFAEDIIILRGFIQA